MPHPLFKNRPNTYEMPCNVENLYIWHSGSKKLTENKKEEISETTENGKNGENSKMAISFQAVGQKNFFGKFYVH